MSDFSFKCSICNQILVAPLEYMGKEVQCPSCKNKIIITGSAANNPPQTQSPISNTPLSDDAQSSFEYQKNSADNSSDGKMISSMPISRLQGAAIIALLSAGILVLALIGLSDIFGFPVHVPRWEYLTVEFRAALEGYNSSISTNRQKILSTTVPDISNSLQDYGKAGWELVNVFLEFETVYPNFGNEDYVSGIQPNIRPQKLVCIFKRKTQKLK